MFLDLIAVSETWPPAVCLNRNGWKEHSAFKKKKLVYEIWTASFPEGCEDEDIKDFKALKS